MYCHTDLASLTENLDLELEALQLQVKHLISFYFLLSA
jgi:hypothetical protein